MLGVLLAGLALAVGIAGLGDVDLWRDKVLASALIKVVCFSPSASSSRELVSANTQTHVRPRDSRVLIRGQDGRCAILAKEQTCKLR